MLIDALTNVHLKDFCRTLYYSHTHFHTQHIHTYICTLAHVASTQMRTLRLLLKNAYDPLLYSQLDLQSYWNTVSYMWAVCVLLNGNNMLLQFGVSSLVG